MLGKTYLERGKPVKVLIKWDGRVVGAKRNVLIQREDGTRVVRPFRGLRKVDKCSNAM
jgi:acetyl esterase